MRIRNPIKNVVEVGLPEDAELCADVGEVSHEEVQPQLGEAQPGRHVEVRHSLPAAGQGVQLTRVVAVVIFLQKKYS